MHNLPMEVLGENIEPVVSRILKAEFMHTKKQSFYLQGFRFITTLIFRVHRDEPHYKEIKTGSYDCEAKQDED